MAKRALNQDGSAKPVEQAAGDVPEITSTRRAKAKAPAKAPAVPKKRKPRARKAPPRLCARWAIFDNCTKQVAIFDYRDRAAADEKLASLLAKNKGLYYLQVVKELMIEPETPEPEEPSS